MPDPLNTLIKGPHRKALRAFVALLKADANLSRVVKTWVDYDPRMPKALAGADYTESMLPLVRLTPETRGWSRATITGVRQSDLDITVEVAIPGANWDESADLWDAIESLVASDAFVDAMAGSGVMDVEVLMPATTVNDTSGPFAVAAGKFRLDMLYR